MGKVFKLRNGMLLLSTEAPGGVYNSAQLQKIAALADRDAAIVKATEDQRLALFVKPDQVKHFAGELKSVGLGVRHFQDGIHQPTACLGQHCPEFQQDALATAMDLTEALASITLDTPLKIGINGCTRCCIPTHTLDISIIGDSSGYRVSLGGKNSQIPEMASFMAEGVPAEKLVSLMSKVVKVYKELAEQDESLQETIDRAGPGKFIQALAPYSQDAAGGGEDPFGSLDDSAENIGEPAVEHDSETLAFDKEPVVESFDDEASLDDSVLAFEEPENPDDLMIDEAGATELVSDDDAFATDDLALAHETDQELVAEDLADEAISIAEDELEEFEVLETDSSETSPAPARDEEAPRSATAIPSKLASSIVAKASAIAATDHESELGADSDSAEEVDGAAADEFEEKLNASIAEEESMPAVEDMNSKSRMEAMRLVETGGDVHEELQVAGGFEDLGIEDNETDDVVDEPSQPVTLGGAASRAEFELVAMEVTREGRLALRFSTGAAIILDPQTLKPGARRELSVAGKTLIINAEKQGVSVEVDGVGLYLPLIAA